MEYIWGKTIKWIKFFPGYAITIDGKVASYKIDNNHKNFIWMKLQIIRGYFCVGLRRNKKLFHRKIHRLVFSHFIGSSKKGFIVHHKDGNPQNNLASNLFLCTRGDHAAMHNRKLSFEDARFIRFLRFRKYGKDITQRLLAKIFGVSPEIVNQIIGNKTYLKPLKKEEHAYS